MKSLIVTSLLFLSQLSIEAVEIISETFSNGESNGLTSYLVTVKTKSKQNKFNWESPELCYSKNRKIVLISQLPTDEANGKYTFTVAIKESEFKNYAIRFSAVHSENDLTAYLQKYHDLNGKELNDYPIKSDLTRR